ncbi:Neuropilin-2 [Exaiptasia diaphana]|nr:Neuropilin-2 [Exaiptasia diaphana]
MCQTKCFSEESEGECVSYNLGPVHGLTRMCELSSSDHWTLPKFLISKEGFEYCPIKNPCSSSPCPQGKLCTPDFAWDTYNCKEGWWANWGSWTVCFLPKTCLQTRKRNCSNPLTQTQVNAAKCEGSELETRDCRLPVYNTTGCEQPLGMEDGRISDSQITASSWRGNDYPPEKGRLNNASPKVWLSRYVRNGEYIQVDLLRPTFVTMVATQGRPRTIQWITKYSLSYSSDNHKWNEYEGDCAKIFPGNNDANTIVTNKLEVPIKARFLRLVIKEFHIYPSMRMEIYGCEKENLPIQ